MDVIAFWVLATVVALAALFVIVARNPVHSVLWLVTTFFTSAGLFVLIGAEFLAMLLVVVYVGAVAVLFLFVVMMLDVDFAELKKGTLKYWPLALLLGILFCAEIVFASFASGQRVGTIVNPMPGAETNTEAIGRVLYTDYAILFQLSGIALLVAMIGAIVLTLQERQGVKRQSVAEQTAKRRDDTVEAVDIPPWTGRQ